MSQLAPALRELYGDVARFSRAMWPQYALRRYQQGPARAVVESVRRGGGDTFCVVFSRQAGKDEVLAQVQAYLLHLLRLSGGTVVLGAPTLNPQAISSRDRLVARLRACRALAPHRTREGRIVEVGQAAAHFLSAGPEANSRGATASRLLIANESQDIEPARWDAVFDPMAASTNATTVFMGTVWTDRTLLARQMAYCRELERRDGRRRLYLVAWEEVARELPAYGDRVRSRMAQLGAQHPLIRTEYCLEELAGDGGLFGRDRQSLMRGDHARLEGPRPGQTYALCVDVAGEEEDQVAGEEIDLSDRRDATALTVVEVDLASCDDPLIGRPSYRVVERRLWVGERHATLYAVLLAEAQRWRARWVLVDATGVGAGLAGFLGKALGRRLLPFVFTSKSKSDLGWWFLAAIDSGRVRDYADDGRDDTALYWRQLGAVEYEVLEGPGRLMRWSVPSATLHDDLVLSAALLGYLDGSGEVDWRSRRARGVVDDGG